jgi:RNA polymerase sigma-70 factor (ECF subfamily)
VKRLVGNETDAEDITQEVFLKALNSLHRFRQESSLQTWLFRIATNLCRDAHRRRQREKGWLSLWRQADEQNETEEGGIVDPPDDRFNPEKLLLHEELSAMLSQAIEQLPLAMREVLILHDVEQMPYEEIAQALGVPLGTVKSRLFHARARLRESLANYVYGV